MILTCGGVYCGTVGNDTKQIDLAGNKLKVGDTVDLYYNKELQGEHVVCKNEDFPAGFIMGVARNIFVKGRAWLEPKWTITKNRDCSQLTKNSVVGDIKYSEMSKNEIDTGPVFTNS